MAAFPQDVSFFFWFKAFHYFHDCPVHYHSNIVTNILAVQKEYNPACTVIHIVPSKVFALLHINVAGDQFQPCNHPFSDGVRIPRQQCWWYLHIPICILSVVSWPKETKKYHKMQGLEHRRMWKVLLIPDLQQILNIRMVMRHCIVFKQDTMLQQLCRFSMKERSHYHTSLA
jgi:hypothetical protein